MTTGAEATGVEEVEAGHVDTFRALLPTATPARTRAAVRQLLRPQRGLAVAGFGLMVLATAVGLLTQPLLGHIVDVVTEHRSPTRSPSRWSRSPGWRWCRA